MINKDRTNYTFPFLIHIIIIKSYTSIVKYEIYATHKPHVNT